MNNTLKRLISVLAVFAVLATLVVTVSSCKRNEETTQTTTVKTTAVTEDAATALLPPDSETLTAPVEAIAYDRTYENDYVVLLRGPGPKYGNLKTTDNKDVHILNGRTVMVHSKDVNGYLYVERNGYAGWVPTDMVYYDNAYAADDEIRN